MLSWTGTFWTTQSIKTEHSDLISPWKSGWDHEEVR